ncbi:TetR/AcrR family transcriptional regulator [Mycobacterium simiae]|uniref:TetR/AcrR family transcriptional regulator n=1 Tax=Mycobacterium simiae TaxID=1784 RepID=A0A5B1BLA3_MYCSI|nr:TetR/AcrR family transcriptional regulator [Mycobacterium simiae]KAA1248771.1 TetR/AcrR family transcriptional regulator [Mycobacterium simiae]
MISTGLRNPDFVFDAAEELVARDGIEALTIRALTKASGISNGAIYRTFESRGGLLGRVWMRAERRFLDLLTRLVGDATTQSRNPLDAVYAAAETSLRYPELYPASAALLLTVRREDVVAHPMPREIAEHLRVLHRELADVMSQLAAGLWGRRDSGAVDLVAACIIELPKWIAIRGGKYSSPMLRDYLRAAVRSVLEVGPPPLGVGCETEPTPARQGGAA